MRLCVGAWKALHSHTCQHQFQPGFLSVLTGHERLCRTDYLPTYIAGISGYTVTKWVAVELCSLGVLSAQSHIAM